jgi:adenosylhomocysteinase
VTAEAFGDLRDGIMLANVGHFGTEIDVPALARQAASRVELREHVDEYTLADGRRVRVLAGGEMLNLTAANGHQIQIMDLGFALQAHSLRLLAEDPAAFAAGYNPVPAEVDRAVAEGGLEALSTVER